eukprot:1158421-Pelagomonas_calceolata.AAC.12
MRGGTRDCSCQKHLSSPPGFRRAATALACQQAASLPQALCPKSTISDRTYQSAISSRTCLLACGRAPSGPL